MSSSEQSPDFYSAFVQPWFAILSRPRETSIHMINDMPTACHVPPVAACILIHAMLIAVSSRSAGDPIPNMLSLAVVGLMIPVVVLVLLAALLTLTGRLLGGRGTWARVGLSVVWSSVPLTWASVVMSTAHLFYLAAGPIPAGDLSRTLLTLLASLLAMIGFCLTILSLLLLVSCTRHVQRFSLPKTLFNIALANAGFFLIVGIVVAHLH